MMPVVLKKDFARDQKVWAKRVMKGRPLYFGIQTKSGREGKFLLTKKSNEAKPGKIKELSAYDGKSSKDKDQKEAAARNKLQVPAAMGVATGGEGTLTLHFEKGKALAASTKFVKHFVARELKCKIVNRVIIAECDKLPEVPEKSDLDDLKPTADSVNTRAAELINRLQSLTADTGDLEKLIAAAVQKTATDVSAADDMLDTAEFHLGILQRIDQVRLRISQQQPANETTVAAQKHVQAAEQHLAAGDAESADESLDAAELLLENQSQTTQPATESINAAASSGVSEEDAAKLREFFQDWSSGLMPSLQTIKNGGGELEPILKLVSVVRKAIEPNANRVDWMAVKDAYKSADELITAALQSLRQNEAAASVPLGTVEFAKAGAAWHEARKEVVRQLKALQLEIADEVSDLDEDEDASAYSGAVQKLDPILKKLDLFTDGLTKSFDQLLHSDSADGRAKWVLQARQIAEKYLEFVTTDRVLLHTVDHPFSSEPVDVSELLAAPLKELLVSIGQEE